MVTDNVMVNTSNILVIFTITEGSFDIHALTPNPHSYDHCLLHKFVFVSFISAQAELQLPNLQTGFPFSVFGTLTLNPSSILVPHLNTFFQTVSLEFHKPIMISSSYAGSIICLNKSQPLDIHHKKKGNTKKETSQYFIFFFNVLKIDFIIFRFDQVKHQLPLLPVREKLFLHL